MGNIKTKEIKDKTIRTLDKSTAWTSKVKEPLINNTNNSNKNNKTTAVKTGDEANTSRFLMLGMSAMAMMTAAGSIFVRRRKTEND